MTFFLLTKSLNVSISLIKWLYNFAIFFLLVHFFLLHITVVSSLSSEIISKLFDNIKIRISNFSIVCFYILIFLSMFLCQFVYCCIFFFLDFFDLSSSLIDFFISKIFHFMLIFQMNFIANSFKFLS